MSIPGPAAPSTAVATPAPAGQPQAAPLHKAAAGSRTPFSTLVAIARAESGFDVDARARRSSATGAFQFTEQTWLQLVKRHGAAAGHADLAARIAINEDGVASVAPEDRAAVLGARRDVGLASTLAAKLCDDSRRNLARKLGRQPDEAEVRMAYFLGDKGAARLLQAAESTPDVSVRALLPRAFANHKSMFTDSRKPMTATQAVDALRQRYESEIATAPKSHPVFISRLSVEQVTASGRTGKSPNTAQEFTSSSTLVAAMEPVDPAKLNQIAPAAGNAASSSRPSAALKASDAAQVTRAEMVAVAANIDAPTIVHEEPAAPPKPAATLVATATTKPAPACTENADGSVSCRI